MASSGCNSIGSANLGISIRSFASGPRGRSLGEQMRSSLSRLAVDGVKNIIVVASGKDKVGKSTIVIASSVREWVADVGAQISDLGQSASQSARRYMDGLINEDIEGKVPNLKSTSLDMSNDIRFLAPLSTAVRERVSNLAKNARTFMDGLLRPPKK